MKGKCYDKILFITPDGQTSNITMNKQFIPTFSFAQFGLRNVYVDKILNYIYHNSCIVSTPLYFSLYFVYESEDLQ